MNEIKRFVIPSNELGFFTHPRKFRYSVCYDDATNSYTIKQQTFYPSGGCSPADIPEEHFAMSQDRYQNWLENMLTRMCVLSGSNKAKFPLDDDDEKWMSFGL